MYKTNIFTCYDVFIALGIKFIIFITIYKYNIVQVTEGH